MTIKNIDSLYKYNKKLKHSYLLGLLAKIKCSICSYQCENWYLSYWGDFFTKIFLGRQS